MTVSVSIHVAEDVVERRQGGVVLGLRDRRVAVAEHDRLEIGHHRVARRAAELSRHRSRCR